MLTNLNDPVKSNLNLINKNEAPKQKNYSLSITKLLITRTTLLTGKPITL